MCVLWRRDFHKIFLSEWRSSNSSVTFDVIWALCDDVADIHPSTEYDVCDRKWRQTYCFVQVWSWRVYIYIYDGHTFERTMTSFIVTCSSRLRNWKCDVIPRREILSQRMTIQFRECSRRALIRTCINILNLDQKRLHWFPIYLLFYYRIDNGSRFEEFLWHVVMTTTRLINSLTCFYVSS